MQSNVIQPKFNSVALYRFCLIIFAFFLFHYCCCCSAAIYGLHSCHFFLHIHILLRLNFCLYAILWVAKLLHMSRFVVAFRYFIPLPHLLIVLISFCSEFFFDVFSLPVVYNLYFSSIPLLAKLI